MPSPRERRSIYSGCGSPALHRISPSSCSRPFSAPSCAVAFFQSHAQRLDHRPALEVQNPREAVILDRFDLESHLAGESFPSLARTAPPVLPTPRPAFPGPEAPRTRLPARPATRVSRGKCTQQLEHVFHCKMFARDLCVDRAADDGGIQRCGQGQIRSFTRAIDENRRLHRDVPLSLSPPGRKGWRPAALLRRRAR